MPENQNVSRSTVLKQRYRYPVKVTKTVYHENERSLLYIAE